MEYVKKKFVDEENRIISWFSTDDNILCNDGKTLREKFNNGIGTGCDGINSTAKTLLETILRNATYTTDQSENITALISALGGNESGE